MLKHSITFLLLLVLVTGAVFANAETAKPANTGIEITGYQIDNGNQIFSVWYNFAEGSNVSIMVYDVTSNPVIEQEYVKEITPIIGIWQERGDGRFDLKIKPDYPENVIVALGSSDGTVTRILLTLEKGETGSVITNVILGNLKANDASWTLSSNDVFNVQAGTMLTNAFVDATNGTFKIGTTKVGGKAAFNADGEITVSAGDTVSLEKTGENGTKTIGFVHAEFYSEAEIADTRTLIVKTDKGGFKRHFKTTGLVGNFLFGALINGVPENVMASDFTIEVIKTQADGENGKYTKDCTFSELFSR